MAKFCGRKNSWSGMRDVFSGLFKSEEIGKDRPLDWIRFYWNLSVGTEIARVSHVERESSGVLHVVAAGKEWVPVLESLESKILTDMNSRVGADRLRRIVFTEGKVEPMEQNKVPPLFKNREKPGRPRLEPMEGNVEMIKDEGLREVLARLGKKLQYLPLAGFLFLTSCAVAPAARNTALSESQDALKLVKQYGANQKDSKAYYYYLKALSAERNNDFEEAADQLARLIKNDPKIEKFYPKLAGFYLRTGLFDKGVALCRTALELFPQNEELHMLMADMLSATGQKDEAVEHYLKALQYDPGNIRNHLIAGDIYFEKKQYDLAQELFRKTLILEANNPLGLFYLGKVFLQNEDFLSARDNFRRAVLLRPNFQEAREYLAFVLEKLGARKEALGEYEMILKLNPENARVGEYLAHLNETKSPAQGRSEFKPQDSSPHVKLGTIYYEQALYLKTIDEFRLVANVDKENTFTLHMVIAKIYELFGRFDKSIKEMEILRQDQPRSVDILLQIALFYSMNGQQKEALNTILTATQIEPDNDQLQHSLALAYMSLHQDDLAIKSLVRAIELNDRKESYYFELGSLQEKMGKIDEAVKNMKRVIELNPDHSNAHNFLGYIYSLQGVNLNEAVGHLEKALLIQPQNGYFLDSLGWIYYKKGEPEKAIVEMKKAMIYTPPDPILYDHLGEIYYALKNYEEAVKAWKSSLQLVKKKKIESGGEIIEPGKIEEKIKKVQRLLEKSL